MWKTGTAGPATADNIIRRMLTAGSITKARHTRSQYTALDGCLGQQ